MYWVGICDYVSINILILLHMHNIMLSISAVDNNAAGLHAAAVWRNA